MTTKEALITRAEQRTTINQQAKKNVHRRGTRCSAGILPAGEG